MFVASECLSDHLGFACLAQNRSCKPAASNCLFCSSSTMPGALMDKAIEYLNGRQSIVKTLNNPVVGAVETSEPVSVAEFVAEACRPCSKTVKSMNVIFDVHSNMPPSTNLAELLQSIASNMDNIPPEIKFKNAIPEASKVDVIFVTKVNGNMDIVKVIYLPRPVNFQMASSLCSGGAFVPVHRPGPWTVKKAVQRLLDQLGGHQLRWHSLDEKVAGGNGSKQAWSASNAELEEGILFINAHAPECDAQNEQTLWVLINIKSDSGAPIAGWPEAKSPANVPKQEQRVGRSHEHDRVPAAYLQLEALSPLGAAALHLPAADELWRVASGMSGCRQNTLCHHSVHGSGQVSCSTVWWCRFETRMAPCQIPR